MEGYLCSVRKGHRDRASQGIVSLLLLGALSKASCSQGVSSSYGYDGKYSTLECSRCLDVNTSETSPSNP